MTQTNWWWVVLFSLLISGPLVTYVGHKAAGWIGGAWQVSGIVVGLVIALMVFLLQAAGGQNLRTQAFYKAIVGRTLLVWPVAMSITFIAWAAIITRFGGSRPASSFADTWLLAMFLADILGLLVVFVRLLALVAPARVVSVVRDAFADNIRRSVEERLRREIATQYLVEACLKTDVKFGGLFDGVGSSRRIWAGRTGWETCWSDSAPAAKQCSQSSRSNRAYAA